MPNGFPTMGGMSDILKRRGADGLCDGVYIVRILRLCQHRRNEIFRPEAVSEPKACE
jgi:hypothetical protein